jgi:hypothetical protein
VQRREFPRETIVAAITRSGEGEGNRSAPSGPLSSSKGRDCRIDRDDAIREHLLQPVVQVGHLSPL